MTAHEFRRRFHNLDAVAVEAMWVVYLTNREHRGAIVTSLDRLSEQLASVEWRARRHHTTAP